MVFKFFIVFLFYISVLSTLLTDGIKGPLRVRAEPENIRIFKTTGDKIIKNTTHGGGLIAHRRSAEDSFAGFHPAPIGGAAPKPLILKKKRGVSPEEVSGVITPGNC